MLERYRGTWGWYNFYPHFDELIHQNDRVVFVNVQKRIALSNGFFCSVFACVGTENSFLRLRWIDYEFRARLDNYTVVPAPKLFWGDAVRIRRKPELVRKVLEIWFHHKRNQIVYHIESTDSYGTSYWFYDELELVAPRSLA
jgi:hypothetical protein